MPENNTAEENFGYQPGNPSGTPTGPALYAPSQGAPETGEGLDLGSADIDALAMAISLEDPSGIRLAGRAWENLSDQFVESMRAVRAAGTTLQDHWESPSASEAFLSQVGRATWSIEDWQSAMGKNAGALNALATQVQTHKTNMATLYGEYLHALAGARAVDDVEATDPMARSTGRALRGGKSAVEHTNDEFSQRARSEVATPLDADYRSAFLKISRGGRWQGPTNAAIPQPAAPPAPGAPGAPGGPGGIAPAGPAGARPGAPRGTGAATPTAASGPPAAPNGLGTATVAAGAMPIGPGTSPQAAGGFRATGPEAPTGSTPTRASVDSASLAGVRRQLEGPAAPAAPGTTPAALSGRSAVPSAPTGPLRSGASGPSPTRPGGSAGLFRPSSAGAPGAPGTPLTGRPTTPGGGAPGRGAPPAAPGGARPGAPGGPGGPGTGLAGRQAPAAPGGGPAGTGGGAPSKGLEGRAARMAPGGRPGGPGPGPATARPSADAGFARTGGGPASGAPTASGRPVGTRPAGPPSGARPAAGSTPAGLGGRPPAVAPAGPRGGMPSRLAGRTDPTTAARAESKDARPSVATKPVVVAKDLTGRLGTRPNATRAEITSAVRAAIRERLAGRAAVDAAPSAPAGHKRDIGEEIEASAFAVLAHYDDEDLFTILSAAPAIIDRIKPAKKVKDPGPAIGVGAW